MKQKENINHKGFTLLELLVVIVIIGILAAIALPQYRLAVDKAHYSTIINITKSLAEANERFYLLNGRYTTKFDELDISVPANRYFNFSGGSISGQRAEFDWGLCTLASQQEVSCYNNTSLKNAFVIFYNQSSSLTYRNQSFCRAVAEQNSRYDKLCKSLGVFKQTASCIDGSCRVYKIK